MTSSMSHGNRWRSVLSKLSLSTRFVCVRTSFSTNFWSSLFLLWQWIHPSIDQQCSHTDTEHMTPETLYVNHWGGESITTVVLDLVIKMILYIQLHNLQPKSGCVLPMHSLLQEIFFCRWPYARISARTSRKRFLWGPHDVGSDSLHVATVLSLPIVVVPMLGSMWHSTLKGSYRNLFPQKSHWG